ncbi:uncharacterized protein ALTATR162_LOCUS148 [Alternaria atra]|uniref:Rhodopsin domain-containing protein n=1 Tax=Alternaria atra TaxID=119953 RepID=A0A8J2MUF8_9PLEO|nr:uncharacterized protein ALTATR162_LOCUS148 [Alternaria atra]CAG5137557.1 unnamed protein product [Alternaria atra]
MSQAAMPPPDGIVADLQHPTDVIRTINFVTQALTLTSCSFFVFIRALHRIRVVGLDLAVDDYLTFISWILMLGYCVCGILLFMEEGTTCGKCLQQEFSTISRYAAYAATIFYAPMTLSIKLSLLSLIARIFAPYKRRVQGIKALGGLLILYYIISLSLKIRICWPISAYWKGQTEKCLNQSAVITADSIISTVTDAIILVLPLPLTWSLQLPRNKKLRVSGMLAVGGLATAFSAWRLHLILTEGKSPDATIIFVQIVLSGNAEAGIALSCTCLPVLVAQFNILKTGVGYGSSRATGLSNNTSGTHKLSAFNLSRLSIGKENNKVDLEDSSDEAELVSHAQGGFSLERDIAQSGGIMRTVEVTHTVTYATSDFEADSEVKGR